MDGYQNKEILQAVLIADNNIDNFRPLSDDTSTSLLPVVNVPLLDYALESLNRSGIEEVFVFSRLFINDVRDHIKKRIASHCSWSINMSVQVIGGEGCRSFGDALRDLDAKALIRGHFILMGADTVTNANLKPILEEHKKTAKFDKGTAMTVIFKEVSARLRTGDEVMIAMDMENNRLHFHQRIKANTKETKFEVPLEVFLNNSQVTLHHNLLDPQIAICSPSLLSLFSDNFDFESRDDFIRGLLINEEILDSRIYVSLLPNEQYASKVSNWLTYQIVSNDVINRWAYPLVPDMGICCLWQNYMFLRNNIYKSPRASVAKVLLKENVVIQEHSVIESGSVVANCVIGRNCKIGKNCQLRNAYLMDGVTVEEGSVLEFCVVGADAKIGAGSSLRDGAVVGMGCQIPADSNISKVLVQKTLPDDEFQSALQKLSETAFIIDDTEELYPSDSEDEDIDPIKVGVPKMRKLPYVYQESDYASSSDEDESRQGSPIPDDTNIFLSEVIDSLSRGFQESSNPDFLILEINSSRYAYNMSLKEVNYNVVKAVFNLAPIKEAGANVLTAIHQVLGHLGPVVTNYIKSEDAMLDCLKAIEETFNQQTALQARAAKIVHYLYDKEYVTEDAILSWYSQLDDESEWLKPSLQKLVDWLNQSSDEDESSEED